MDILDYSAIHFQKNRIYGIIFLCEIKIILIYGGVKRVYIHVL